MLGHLVDAAGADGVQHAENVPLKTGQSQAGRRCGAHSISLRIQKQAAFVGELPNTAAGSFNASAEVFPVAPQSASDLGLAPTVADRLQDQQLPEADGVLAGPLLIDLENDPGAICRQLNRCA